MRFSPFIVLAAASLAISKPLFSSEHHRNCSSTILPLTSAVFNTIFDVEFQFANQTFNFLVDTGSSDTWVMQTGFQCFNASTNLEIPAAACNFANTTYDVSSTFQPIPNEIFGVQYGTGIGSGLVGFEDVTIGGLEVKNQTIGIVNKSTNPGDGQDSGLIGLAYPGLTSAHPGTIVPPNDTFIYNRSTYDPLLFTMAKQGLIEPFFSLALQRTPRGMTKGPGGYLGLGSIPPVEHSSNWTTVPVEILDFVPANATGGIRQLAFWATTIDVTFGTNDSIPANQTTSNSFQVHIDSGSPTIGLPGDLPATINSLFDPPALAPEVVSDPWIVDCNAKTPAFAITIGGQKFRHNGQDLIIELGEGRCMSAVVSSDSGGIFFNVIGAPFLKNVVAVFDFGRDEMRFAAAGK